MMLMSLASCRFVLPPLLLLAPSCWTDAPLFLRSCYCGPGDLASSGWNDVPMMLMILPAVVAQ